MKIRVLSIMSALAIVLSFMTMPVKADPYNGGIAIGVTFSANQFDSVGKELEGNATNLPNGEVDTNNKSFAIDEELGSAFLEGSFRVGDGLGIGLTIGGEYMPGEFTLGSGTRTDVTTDVSEAVQDDGTYTAKGTASDHMTFYAEPTIYITNNLGIYAKGGISRIVVKSLEDLEVGADSSTYDDKAVTGTVKGVGVKAISPWGIFVKLEYVETDYDSITLTSSSGNKNQISGDIDQESTRIALGYQF